MHHDETCALTITVRKSIREQLQRFCALHDETQTEVLEQLIQIHCTLPESTKEAQAVPPMHSIRSKPDFIAHVLACFQSEGGELKKDGPFLKNERFLVHTLYRKLGQNESRVITTPGSKVTTLLHIAEEQCRIPLIAFLAIPFQGDPILGVLDPQFIPRPTPGMPGRKLPVFLRDNFDIFVHLRNETDRAMINQLSRQSLPDSLFNNFFGGLFL